MKKEQSTYKIKPMPQEKWVSYAALIAEKVNDLIEEEGWAEDFEEGENITAFLHAFSSVAPNLFYQSITGKDSDSLSFNHIANRLVFQYSTNQQSKNKDNE